MRNQAVRELMTTAVIRVHHRTGLREVSKILAGYNVKALPVVDDEEHPLGVVTGADLPHRQSRRPDPSGFPSSARLRPVGRLEPRTESGSASDVMSAPAVTAHPEWSVAKAAREMEERGVKRLPVVDDAGELVGVVSRADLLRVLLREDADIAREISRDVLGRTLSLAPAQVAVTVSDGKVMLRGSVEEDLIPVVERLCWSVDGVADVRNDVTRPAVEPRNSIPR
jgi:CBS domain-containing protein